MAEHVVSPKVYLAVYLTLLALVLATTLIARVDLGWANLFVALLIAGAKAMVVVLFFMHLKYAEVKMAYVFAIAGLFWLGILFSLTLSDYLSRGWLPGGY